MASGKRKRNKRKVLKKSRTLIDNPLFQSTLKAPQSAVKTTTSTEIKDRLALLHKELEHPQRPMSPEEEKISVFEIISDLEKQLDVAFSTKETQEAEILKLRGHLVKMEERAGSSEAKLKELKGMIVSQEELNAQLEFLENERLEAAEKIKSLEENLEQKSTDKKDLQGTIETLNKEINIKGSRIEQIELELNNANKAIQSFQRAIEIDPNNAEAWFEMAQLLYGEGNTEDARACFDKAASINPGYAGKWFGDEEDVGGLKCPVCGIGLAGEVVDCPGCGVVFTLAERQKLRGGS